MALREQDVKQRTITNSARIPTLITALALLLWSLFTYLTVRVDADIVAEAIQVQRWLQEPFWVLSYPGQLYGGVLEYPFIALAETLSPGNVYAFTLLRILYLPIIGVLLCVNAARMFPRLSLWPIAIGAIAGPAVLHTMLAIKDLYPFSWLLAMIGITLIVWQVSADRRPWLLLAGGVFIGLAAYQHPTSMLLSLPFLAAIIVRCSLRWAALWRIATGGVLGIVPLFMGLTLQPNVVVVFSPDRGGVPNVLGAFGLTLDSWPNALVPNGWGLQTTDLNVWVLPPGPQLIVNGLLALALLGCAIFAVPAVQRYLRKQDPLPADPFVVLWATVIIAVVVLTLAARPVWFYGAALAFLVWLTLAALARHRVGLGVLVIVVAFMAVSSLGSLLDLKPGGTQAITFKANQVAEVRALADAIAAADIDYVYGSYWEVLPIAYASTGDLHPLTPVTNRFPLPADAGEVVTVAVASGRSVLPIGLDRWPMAEEAQEIVEQSCVPISTSPELPDGFQAYACPRAVVSP
jgi:hypothetical protein